MAFSDYGSMFPSRPDRPLVVKCTFDRSAKRITFSSARNCSYELLRKKVEQCFSLSAFSYSIAYKDDDGEITDITTESDLTEAIQYFQAGVDDLPISSTASILSGRSLGSRKITLRVHVNVDYDGPSLSDTSSLVSMEEYKGRNGSDISLSFSSATPLEPDDDSVTVSSRDAGILSADRPTADTAVVPRGLLGSTTLPISTEITTDSGRDSASLLSGRESMNSLAVNGIADLNFEDRPDLRYPEDPEAVFERLKLAETSQNSQSFLHDLDLSGRGAQWLRDQKARTMNGIISTTGESSVSDGMSDAVSFSIDDSQDQNLLPGALALQQDTRGKYYYTYTAGSSSAASQSHDSGYDDSVQHDSFIEKHNSLTRTDSFPLNEDWLASQQRMHHPVKANSLPSSSRPAPHSFISDPLPDITGHIHPDIPPEVLQFLGNAAQPPDECTDCSECGVMLDSFRYVCSTCGEKKPKPRVELMSPSPATGKGKARANSDDEWLRYPPPTHRSSPSSGSSWSDVGDVVHPMNKPLPSKPLPLLPILHSSLSSPASPSSPPVTGYELCVTCIESAGVFHALEGSSVPGTSPGGSGNSLPPSPEDSQRTLSQLRRSAPKRKGHFRHAYMEKVWGPGGWKDVEQDDTCKCTICKTTLTLQRYKCASCPKFDLCRACYSQVHEIHPSHAFLVVPDRPLRARSEPELAYIPPDDGLGEQSMTHPGVKCAHCMLDIVGARFHCAICESVDICANCESAGLPGNLDAPDGGHNSSHIMIKIPRPLKMNEVQTASRRALHLWTGRDAPNVQRTTGRPRANSVSSIDAQTVIGSRTSLSRNGSHSGAAELVRPDDHRITCRGCNTSIVGIRYQCATCPSSPIGYSLCSNCEIRSYTVHDPMHVFFKLPRPVDQPIESEFQILPVLYRIPAGPRDGVSSDPKAYLRSLYHRTAVCDRCMERIRGEWFRCAYCAKDLCDECEALDTHDSTHVFIVFKSAVDMPNFRMFADLENPPPVLKYPVYFS